MMNKALLSLVLAFWSGLAQGRDLILVTQVSPALEARELNSSLRLAMASAGAGGQLGEIIPVSPFAHALLFEARDTSVKISAMNPGLGPQVRYLMPQQEGWVVAIDLGAPNRILDELILEYSFQKPEKFVLGSQGVKKAYWLATPGVYNLTLAANEIPVRYQIKTREAGKAAVQTSGYWPAVGRYFAIPIHNFTGDIHLVLNRLGDKKILANPLTLAGPAKESSISLGVFTLETQKPIIPVQKPMPPVDVATKPKQEPEKPCVGCPPARRGVLGIFRR